MATETLADMPGGFRWCRQDLWPAPAGVHPLAEI